MGHPGADHVPPNPADRRRAIALAALCALVGIQLVAPGGWAGLLMGTEDSATSARSRATRTTTTTTTTENPAWTAAPTNPSSPVQAPATTAPPLTGTNTFQREPLQADMTVEHKLRSIDAGTTVPATDPAIRGYRTALDALEAVCEEPRDALGDFAVRAQEVVRDRAGYEVTVLEIIEGIGNSVPKQAPVTRCSDYFAAWLALIVD